MRYVILGTGLLGWNLARHLDERGIPHVALDHRAIDAAGGLAPAARASLRPGDVLVNAAALTTVDACEDREEEAMRVNGEAPGELAELGARFVHVSTDAVLDVTNVYAKSKALGEARVREAAGDDALIVRVSTSFGPHPTRADFAQWLARTLREKGRADVLVDMISSPTYTPDAARAIVAAVAGGARGTHQLVNHPGLSRCDFARLVQKEWGLPGEIRAVRMDEFRGFRARRPRDTSMRSTMDAWHAPMPLDACLRDYRERAALSR
jgi:dTDP-4-dehydrorhamnose reductase